MDIFLIRHAKSAHDNSKWKTDDIRPLAKKGIQRQKAATEGMQTMGIKFDNIWVSPFLRARQTLDIIQEGYNTNIEPEIVDDLRVWGEPREVKNLLEEFYLEHRSAKLLLVGHNPNMSNLVRLLVGQRIDMRTSDVVHIRRDENSYKLVEYYPRKKLMDI